jgi:hypothetical protein
MKITPKQVQAFVDYIKETPYCSYVSSRILSDGVELHIVDGEWASEDLQKAIEVAIEAGDK